jgi:hypothetical protein
MTRRAPISRSTLASSLLLAALVIASTVLPAGSASAAKPRHVAHKNVSALGVYTGPGNVAGVEAFQSQIGTKVGYVMDFLDGTSWQTISHPADLAVWSSSDYKMILGVPMLPNTGGTLAAGAQGAYDGYYATLGRALVAAGQESDILRIGWEFNGNWFPWAAANHAPQYVQYYRNIVTAMRAIPGANFKFEWNPSRGDVNAGNLALYWPGNKYVDYVGLSVFDEEWQNYPGQPAEFKQMLTEADGLNWMATFSAAHHKAMVIPELGLGWGKCSASGAAVTGPGQVCGGDDGVFVKQMSHWIDTHNVFETSFWDYGTSLVNNKPKTVTALRTSWAA